MLINNFDTFQSFLSVNKTEGGNLSIRGLAALCGVDDRAILRGADFNSDKLAEKLTEYGFEGADLLESGFNAESAWLVIEYFAYESKAKAEGAKMIARVFGSYGIKQAMAIVEPAPKSPTRQLPPIRDTIEYIQASKDIDLISDPILRSYLTQSLYEDLGVKALPPAEECLVLAAVLARDLGYVLKPGDDARLGKWVKRHHEPKGKVQHGRYEVNVYEVSEIKDTVHAFFR